jgi:hypothetical protein
MNMCFKKLVYPFCDSYLFVCFLFFFSNPNELFIFVYFIREKILLLVKISKILDIFIQLCLN